MRIVTESTKYPMANGYSVLLAEYFNSDPVSVLTVLYMEKKSTISYYVYKAIGILLCNAVMTSFHQ